METQPPGIPNFKNVSGDVYRGGQPTNDGWDYLKKQLSIERVIKLNTEAEGSDVAAEALGMEVLYYPIPLAEQIIFKPNKQLVMLAVQAIKERTFVHCTHGTDRTGLVIGCYRYFCQGLTKDEAWADMLANGFHPELLGLTLFWEWSV